jgi:hypothetical protein
VVPGTSTDGPETAIERSATARIVSTSVATLLAEFGWVTVSAGSTEAVFSAVPAASDRTRACAVSTTALAGPGSIDTSVSMSPVWTPAVVHCDVPDAAHCHWTSA